MTKIKKVEGKKVISGRLISSYAEAVEALNLTPQQRQFLRYYHDPLLPTYGNKRQSALAAGLDEDKMYRAMQTEGHPLAQGSALIEAERDRMGKQMRDKLVHYAPDALREIVNQLSLGRDLEFIVGDPEGESEKLQELEGVIEAGEGRSRDGDPAVDAHRAITTRQSTRAKHNREVTQAAKERRAAAELILEYSIGKSSNVPQEGERDTGGGIDLSDLSDDQLEELHATLDAVREFRDERAVVVEAEEVD